MAEVLNVRRFSTETALKWNTVKQEQCETKTTSSRNSVEQKQEGIGTGQNSKISKEKQHLKKQYETETVQERSIT